ncbi:HAMP domain-containing protein [Rhodoplanes sp. TEM]|uniref:histidine kinase n=1 Tax=Rhodoplanes tepidamans TaxID=200616 RepID=A0ABT5J9N0_RHOTP|nr:MULTISPECIES: HAMP domain-containing protein [Rhodoplanes]MDC7786314.1 HAMP domain-containing protein [Rhodoplanes tepidamans]MDC7984727.1 HAMP domain-containing protein [Rhodoplanes sp. TEM]
MRGGDFSVRMRGDHLGLAGKIADAFNDIVATNERMAQELARVGEAVGRKGRTRHRVRFSPAVGAWADMETSVNGLIDDLLWPTKEVTRAVAAVAQGDLLKTVRLEVDGRPLEGEFLESATIVNTMIKQLGVFTSEVTRVAREVGTEGKLGGQAQVREVSGVWKDLTENVNSMASNLTAQVRNIAEVTIAVANGDLSKKITVDVRGEILLLKEAINTMVDQLRSFASEVTRVAREVGTDGKLGGQATVPGVAGTWKDLTDSVNAMCGNLTDQVRNIAEVTTAVARGDLSRKITVDVRGEILELKDTINTMVDQLNGFASEVTRVAREVGTEGKLGGQAAVPGVAGTWKDLTDSVNFMASNLTAQVRNIAEVATAIAGGDLGKKITVTVSGEILQLKETINTMVDRLNAFAGEVTRVAREVGTEGELGGQAVVPGVAGIWKDLTDSVNAMCGNLTDQVRNIAQVTTAVARGDLSRKITVDVRGEILELKDTINTMVDQLNGFASEVTRVAREVGTEGKLGGQATVPGVAGTWKDLTDSVNSMASNLTAQVRNIAEVATAVAKGDLSKKITVDVRGEILELKDTLNTMVDQLNGFASEVTRVAREVGTDGKLGGQAEVRGVAGTWKDLTDSVNSMAGNLTAQVRNIAEVATAIASGDLSRKITVDVRGEILELKETLNTMVDQLNRFANEVTRVAREVGTEGRLGGQANVPGVAGTWKDLTDNVNLLAANLTTQVRNIAEVTTAVARGDLSRKITVDVKGEILELKNTINTMVDQLNAFAAEVTRVAREVGTEGKLGGQAGVPGVAGTWKDLTDNVNFMASNLTAQVRNIAEVATAIAGGDLSKKITVDVRGEILLLKETLNTMVEQLRSFASEVTRVAHEVGVEGRLGGQAVVPGAAGTWKDLTGNVNLLAANLTNQVRAIAEVATAVTKGDLTRSIQVEARGEVAQLKDNINTMIDNLRLTTERNTEQDWLKTNLARFTNMLQGQRDLGTVGRLLLDELTPLVGAQQGVIYQMEVDAAPRLRLLSAYADSLDEGHKPILVPGEGLAGQCAVDKRRQLVTEIPPDAPPIVSSLFKATPRNIVVLPVLFENQVKAVIELASIGNFKPLQIAFLEQLTASIGIVLNSIEATMQTEGLLQQSQQLAAELQAQQRELQQTNEQLEQKAQQLAERNVEVERKNQEIEHARRALEEQAAELALTSKYKSEFLANMSHELRTPLNSILILGQQLADNPDRNLSDRQVEFARTIHGAGTDLLNLISDILDLSKIESGTVTVEAEELLFSDLLDAVARPFRHEAETRQLDFSVDADAALGRSIVTDPKRLQQVLKNLLSNAFKFTERGSVRLGVTRATSGWTPTHPVLSRAASVVAFEVSDTGIGIPTDKQKIVFEAFQQADASTSRRFGGTGLGLAISRELAALLGGEIQLHSTPGTGSTFVLYLPSRYTGPSTALRPAAALPPRRPPQPAGGVSPFALEGRTGDAPAEPASVVETIRDDRQAIAPGDFVLLIVEDDAAYAGVIADLAHRRGFKVLIATRGADVPELARRHQPSAISLDVHLPDMLGWSVLGRLKQDPLTRHIPVQVVTVDEDRQHGLARGAFAYIRKPTTTEGIGAALERIEAYARPRRKRLLIVDDDRAARTAIAALLGDDDIEIAAAETGAEALALLRHDPHDCVVLDLRLPDTSGFDVLEAMRDDPALAEVPVVVYTGRALGAEEHARLRTLARSIVVKGVESPERLLDETALVLHRQVSRMSPEKRRMLERLHESDDLLVGRTVLLVDDDARNIFALSSVLERRGMRVLTATTGREAIDFIEATPDLALVLMDIMMPEMDGYETMETIRRDPRFGRLPIIALTAKAMKGDREKCLEAGASDYLAKPVNTEQLLSALRMWLHR